MHIPLQSMGSNLSGRSSVGILAQAQIGPVHGLPPTLRAYEANHLGPFNDGPHLFMSIRGNTVPTSFLPVDVVASKYEQFQQAEPLVGAYVTSKPLGLLHQNTQTLRDPVKQAHYTQQLRRNNIFIATCPESRIKVTDVQAEHGFIMVTSACTSGGYSGCSIWIDPKFPVASCDGVDQFVGIEDISILHADPRRLIIRIRRGSLVLWPASMDSIAPTTVRPR